MKGWWEGLQKTNAIKHSRYVYMKWGTKIVAKTNES